MPPSWQVEIDAFPEYYADYLGKYTEQVSPMTTMVCTGPISYTGPRPAADRHREPAGRAGRARGHRGVPALDQPQRVRPQRVLPEPRRVPRRGGRGAARGVPGHRRGRVPAAGRRPVADRVPLGEPGDHPRAAPGRRRAAHRDPQPRAARHPGREDPAAHLLRAQPRPAHPRPRLPRHRPADAEDQRRRLLVRGGQPAPPARVEDLAGHPAARREDPHSRACSGTPPTTSSTPS